MQTPLLDRLSVNSAIPRVAPFALFMGFIGIDEGLRFLVNKGFLHLSPDAFLIIYPIKILVVGFFLLYLRKYFIEISWSDLKHPFHTAISVFIGITVFILWINMDWEWATFGKPSGYNPTLIKEKAVSCTLIAFRLFGASIIVPIIEELFWRSWLVRYLISQDFSKVQIGLFTWTSFIISSILFGLEHNLIVAGIMAGMFYNLLLFKFRSITQCILSHAVTNLLLGVYVLMTGRWQFW